MKKIVLICLIFSVQSSHFLFAQELSEINMLFKSQNLTDGLNLLYSSYKDEFFTDSIEKVWIKERSTNIIGSLISEEGLDFYSVYLYLTVTQDIQSHKFKCMILHSNQSMVRLTCAAQSNCGKVNLEDYLTSYGSSDNGNRIATDGYIYDIQEAIDRGHDSAEYLIHIDQIFPSLSNAFYYKKLDQEGQND